VTELNIGEFLLELAVLFFLTYVSAALLEKLRIPVILSALLVSMAAQFTPLGQRLLAPEFQEAFSFLANLGVMFILFFIGLQIDFREMSRSRSDIVWLTVLNTTIPFVLGMAVMRMLGYDLLISFVIGLTCMPTAEAVIVPILDEFNMIRTRVGELIIGTGVLDDVIEVFMISFVSVWISHETEGIDNVLRLVLGSLVFIGMIWVFYRWIVDFLGKWMSRRPRNLMLLSIIVLFGFSGISEFVGLGMIVGAIVSGIIMKPEYNKFRKVGEEVEHNIQIESYGFLGLLFFFWVGLHADLKGIAEEPVLVILLFSAAFFGKLLGTFIMVPIKKFTGREAWLIGIGINARLTTEIIVVQLLFHAKVIDVHLYTALLASSSASSILVPLIFTFLVSKWGDQFKNSPSFQKN
jgi:P-type Ca2+ transporter type 2C